VDLTGLNAEDTRWSRRLFQDKPWQNGLPGGQGLHGEGNGWKRFSLECGSGKAVAWPNQDVGVPYPIPYKPATPRIKAG
jgi:hypothetical protein